jgi:hypothetical protein
VEDRGAARESARLHQHLGAPHKASSELRAVATADAGLVVELAWRQVELGATFEAEAALARISTADPWLQAVMATIRGRTLAANGDARNAERAYVEAQHGFASLGADLGIAQVQRHFAEILAAASNGRRAVALLEESAAVLDDVGDRRPRPWCTFSRSWTRRGMRRRWASSRWRAGCSGS